MNSHRVMCFITAALTASMLIGAACSKKSTGKVDFKTDNEKMSYIFGTQVGSSFKDIKSKGYELNLELFQRGMKDALDSAKLALSDSQIAQAMQLFEETMRKKQEEKFEKDLAENQLKASKFLAENATKAGVVTLPPDSLQYQEMKAGTGPQAKSGQTVKVKYKGSFLDGTEFDSSEKHGGEPLEFTLGQPGMIPGFSEAVSMMKVGSTWKIFIPPKLAYGQQGSRAIPPNSLLIFEIELLEISKQAATK